jgi:hypothetical protein
VGEEKLGRVPDALAGPEVQVLNDRRIPESRANIDHLAITSAGLFVIDSKRYADRPQLRVEDEILRPRVEKLLVGRRGRTNLVTGVLEHAGLVRSAIESSGLALPVHGVLCFVDADWPCLAGHSRRKASTSPGRAGWPRSWRATARFSSDLSASTHDLLERRFPPT